MSCREIKPSPHWCPPEILYLEKLRMANMRHQDQLPLLPHPILVCLCPSKYSFISQPQQMRNVREFKSWQKDRKKERPLRKCISCRSGIFPRNFNIYIHLQKVKVDFLQSNFFLSPNSICQGVSMLKKKSIRD